MSAGGEVGQRVRFRDDHPEYPGMTGTIDQVFEPWLASARADRPGYSVTLDPVFAAPGDLLPESVADTREPAPPIPTRRRRAWWKV